MVQFESPDILLALVVLVPLLLYWHARSYADLPLGRRRLVTTLRFLGLSAVLLALARPVLMLENQVRTVLFLLDVSESVPAAALERAVEEIRAATQDLEADERAGVVAFAGRPALVVPPSSEPLELTEELRRQLLHGAELERLTARVQELERGDLDEAAQQELEQARADVQAVEAWRAELDSEGTDLEAACRLARGLVPLESRRRVVVYSDGNGNQGDLLREVTALAEAGFTAHTRVLQHEETPEVIAEQLLLPAEARVKAPFRMELAVASNTATEAEVRIYRNGYLTLTKDVQLRQGRNLLELDRVTLEEGFHEFEAHVTAKADTALENNVARGLVRVAGRPKVLLVEREEREARYLTQALGDEGLEVEVRPEAGLPRSLEDLLNYEVLVLSDVPADRFAPGAMEAVKTYVRDFGGGLVMLGGEQSFGLGGYYRTPIEDALPVKMPIKKDIEKPNLALVLVIDKSGSMSGAKIELAKEAAIASAEVLKSHDRFGVVAFDGAAQWISPITSGSESGLINNNVARLVAGGGTNIYPALYEAYQALLDEDAKLKHVILLSDGQTQGSGYDTLVSHMTADGVTLSTVGIGDGADAKLLGDMASWGGGEYYFTNDFGSIPQIFTRETMRASKSMLVEEPFVPAVTGTSDALKGIAEDSLPFLLGYVATQAKERATVALASDYGDPVLAQWSYGLGHAVAFTSDAKTRWGGDWLAWEGFGKFWGQLLRSTLSTGAHKELRTAARVDVERGIATVTLDVRDREGAFRDDVLPEVSILSDEAEEDPLEIEHVAPGLFRASFPIERYGEYYRLLVVQRQGDQVVDLRTLGVTESYSPEFRAPLPDEDGLRSLAERTGGVFQGDAQSIWTFTDAPARTPRETWWWWLLLASLLLPLDIALRRLAS